ncbi:MAG: ABC transporter substrate-binding protein [Clostridia bacterium]|nr:MAG: ABC transporter substrate-binding protein [Clostridia bacterium]
MQRFLSLAGVILLLLLAVACGGGTTGGNAPETGQPSATGQPEPTPGGQAAGAKPLKLGIIQLAEHPSLDQARQGFLDVLAERGYKDGSNLTVEYENAQGDASLAATIAKKLVADKVDLALAIATGSAQAMAEQTKDIPILITAVTDPVGAGLAQSLEKPGGNVTGTTDMNPVKEQLALIKEMLPQAKKAGIIYNSGEANSVVQVKIAKQAAGELGLELAEATAANTGEVLQAASSLVGKVDALYVPTDNTVVSALDSVIKVAEDNDLPLIVGEGDSVKKGGLATVGLDYYKLGKQTGEMALRIWEDNEKPADMPIETQKEYETIVNLKAAENMGVRLPQSLLDRATKVE